MESLLDVVLANTREEQIGGAYLCRLAVACSLKSRQSSTEYAQVLQESWADITGLMLVLPSCLVMLLEGDNHALQTAVSSITAQQSAGAIQEAKVLLYTEGEPAKCCKSMYSAFIPSASSMEAAEPADPSQVVRLSSSVVAVMGRVANSISTLSEYETRRQLSSLASFHEDLPTPEVLLALTASCELPAANEWSQMHLAGKQSLLLDDEVVWPISRTVIV